MDYNNTTFITTIPHELQEHNMDNNSTTGQQHMDYTNTTLIKITPHGLQKHNRQQHHHMDYTTTWITTTHGLLYHNMGYNNNAWITTPPQPNIYCINRNPLNHPHQLKI